MGAKKNVSVVLAAAWLLSASLHTASYSNSRNSSTSQFARRWVVVSPTFVSPWGHALALSMTPVTTTWYNGHASTWLSYALPPPPLDGELLDGRQGGIHCCAVLAQTGDRRLYCLRPPLITCPSRLLQMGGGACQAHEPADRGGHATGGKSSPTF